MRKISFIIFIYSLFFISCNNSKDSNTITASGTIESINVTVSTKTMGQVLRIIINEGDKVKKGDLLVEIDHALLDIQLRQAEASVEIANAQLKLLLRGARREDIKQSEELLKQTKINLEQSRIDKERMENLFRTNTITQKQYDDAVTRFDLALTQYNSARENLQKVKTIIRPEEIESARGNLKKSDASVDLLKQNIEDCKIYAPVDGIISKKYIEQGENVNPNSSILKISNLETVNLVIYINEVDIGKVKLGQNSDVNVDAFKDKVYNGKIIFISPDAEFTPKNIQTQDERTKLVFAVKIEIPNPQYELKPGMPADAKLKF